VLLLFVGQLSRGISPYVISGTRTWFSSALGSNS
jgi:hypothetical protein